MALVNFFLSFVLLLSSGSPEEAECAGLSSPSQHSWCRVYTTASGGVPADDQRTWMGNWGKKWMFESKLIVLHYGNQLWSFFEFASKLRKCLFFIKGIISASLAGGRVCTVYPGILDTLVL